MLWNVLANAIWNKAKEALVVWTFCNEVGGLFIARNREKKHVKKLGGT